MGDRVAHEQKSRFRILPIILTFLAVVLVTFGGIYFVMRGNFFAKPGELIFDASVPETAKTMVKEATEGLVLKQDVTVKSHRSLARESGNHSVLYEIMLATSDFYDPTISISAPEAENLTLTPFSELDFRHKLLEIDGEYFLDNLDNGAFFEYLDFEGDNSADLDEISAKVLEKAPHFPTADEVLDFAQTGVTALSRGMNKKLQQTGDAAAFATNIAAILSGFDLTHTSNESSFSKFASSENICSDPRMIDVLTGIGLDIVELTGNHNQDCGDEDAIQTIEQYHALGMQTFGGGKTADEAAIPLEISQKNTNITLLGYNYSTGGYTTDATPGANLYTPEKAEADIAAAKARGDFVIVDVQFFECNSYVATEEDTTCDVANSSAGDQIGFFRHLIDLGADIVVGTAAHQPQTFELYGDGVIYYGLGNLFFDQSWWPGTTRSLMLAHYFYNGKLLQTRLMPTIYDHSYQTKLMEDQDASNFIARLIAARPNL